LNKLQEFPGEVDAVQKQFSRVDQIIELHVRTVWKRGYSHRQNEQKEARERALM
jgi:hypothetical protein